MPEPQPSAADIAAVEKILGGSIFPPVAYCVACRQGVKVKDLEHIAMKNGKPALRGRCENCLGPVFKIGLTYRA